MTLEGYPDTCTQMLRNRVACPHPEAHVQCELRSDGEWRCSDVETASFSCATQAMALGECPMGSMTYAFRLRFRLAATDRINCREQELEFDVGGNVVKLKAVGERSIRDSQELTLSGYGFGSEAEASAVGERLKDGLRWFSIKHRVGVDVGQDQRVCGATKAGKAEIRRMFGFSADTRILDDVHGLQVWDEGPPTEFATDHVALTVGRSAQALIDAENDFAARGLRIEEPLKTALDLYAASQFLTAPEAAHSATGSRARFLSLWTALESLTGLLETTRGERARQHVAKLMELTEAADLPGNERQSLLGALRHLKEQSIGKLCQQLVGEYVDDEQYGDEDAVSFAKKCYSLRCKLTHGSASADELALVCPELEKMVGDVIVRVVHSGGCVP